MLLHSTSAAFVELNEAAAAIRFSIVDLSETLATIDGLSDLVEFAGITNHEKVLFELSLLREASEEAYNRLWAFKTYLHYSVER